MRLLDQILLAPVAEQGFPWSGTLAWINTSGKVLFRFNSRGGHAMRISVSSWATTDADVDRSLDAMLRIARAEKVGGP